MSDECPLCGMPMVEGPSLDRHHLIPKSKKGTEMELCHMVCHRKIHSVFTDWELMQHWHTWPRIRVHHEIVTFVKWVRKQFKRDPEFIDRHKQHKSRKRRR